MEWSPSHTAKEYLITLNNLESVSAKTFRVENFVK